MKIQSRKPASTIPAADTAEITCYLRNLLEIYGYRNGTEYKRVLAEGAGAILIQMGVIRDFQAYSSGIGMGTYGITVQLRMEEGSGCETIHL